MERDEIIDALKAQIDERERLMPRIIDLLKQVQAKGDEAENLLGEPLYGGAIATLAERSALQMGMPIQALGSLLAYTEAIVGLMLVRAERGEPDASWLDGVDLSNLEGGNV